MAVTFVDSATGSQSFPDTQTLSITVSGTNTAVFVMALGNNVTNTSQSVTRVTVGGVTATQIAPQTTSGGSLWVATGVPTGTKTISATWSPSGGNFTGTLAAVSYSGAVVLSSIQTRSTTNPITLTDTGQLALAFWTVNGTTSVNQGDTRRANIQTGNGVSIYIAESSDAVMGLAKAPMRSDALWITESSSGSGGADSTFTFAPGTVSGGLVQTSPAVSTFTETSTAGGSYGARAGVTTSVTATATADGIRGQRSPANTTILFTSDASGTVGGTAASTFGFTSAADGVRGQSSGADAAFTVTSTANGGFSAVGMASSTFAATSTANGHLGARAGAATVETFDPGTVIGFNGPHGTATSTFHFSSTVGGAPGGTADATWRLGSTAGGYVTRHHVSPTFDAGNYDPWQAFIEADALAERREVEDKLARPEFEIDLYTNVYGRLGEISDYISATVVFSRRDIPTATIVLKGDDPLAVYALQCDETVVPITITVNGMRWSGRVDVAEDDMVDGVETITLQCVGDRNWLNKILVWPNFALPIQVQFPKHAIYLGSAVTVCEVMLTEQLIRLQSGIWELVNNITNPGAWFATAMMHQGLETPCVVIPGNPLTDTSKFVAVTGRMDTVGTLVDQICKDNGIQISADIWLPGEPQPTTAFTLTEPTICFRVLDKSGVTGPTGTFLDGIIEEGVDLLNSAFGEVIKPFLNPLDEYAPDGVDIAPALGVHFTPPWPVYDCDDPRSGVKECKVSHHHPLAYTVVGGGKSPDWVNKLIDLLLEMAVTAILAAVIVMNPAAAGVAGAIPSTLLDGVFDNVILAFQLIENADRRRKLGPYGYPEFFTSTGSTAYTLEEWFALEIAMWDTRGYTSGQITTYDGVPYTLGRDFVVGDMVSYIRRKKLYTDYVEKATVTDDRTTRVQTMLQIGDGSAQESPHAKLQRRLASFESAVQIALLSSN